MKFQIHSPIDEQENYVPRLMLGWLQATLETLLNNKTHLIEKEFRTCSYD